MAGQADVTVKGLNETVRTLIKLGVEVQDLKDAFHRIGNLVVQEAQSLAPRRSGKLASTIKASNTRNKSVVRAGAGIKYAGVQNFGWPKHNITGKYFMQRAVTNKHDEVIQALDTELHGLIRGLGLGN